MRNFFTQATALQLFWLYLLRRLAVAVWRCLFATVHIMGPVNKGVAQGREGIDCLCGTNKAELRSQQLIETVLQSHTEAYVRRRIGAIELG